MPALDVDRATKQDDPVAVSDADTMLEYLPSR
jgi:hypothetical protein